MLIYLLIDFGICPVVTQSRIGAVETTETELFTLLSFIEKFADLFQRANLYSQNLHKCLEFNH